MVATPSLFLLLVVALTWALWIPAGLLSATGADLAARLLHYAGGVMPFFATMALLYTRHAAADRRDFWLRVLQPRRIGRPWWLAVLCAAPLLTFAAAAVGGVLDTPGLVARSWTAIPYALFLLVFGPVPEELVWRGYALDGLQARRSALLSSIVLGAVWTVWHLPLFFIRGSYQHGLGLGTARFWLYMLDKIPQSILMTWIYNNTQRSTLSAILFHYSVNLTGELLDLTLRAEMVYMVLWITVAIVVAAVWGPERLSRRARCEVGHEQGVLSAAGIGSVIVD